MPAAPRLPLLPRFALEGINTPGPYDRSTVEAEGWILCFGWLGLVIEITFARVKK